MAFVTVWPLDRWRLLRNPPARSRTCPPSRDPARRRVALTPRRGRPRTCATSARSCGPAPRLVAGMDEVGRGALAGPVSVGVVVVDARTRRVPAGVADSKLLDARARGRACCPRCGRWGLARAVGHASADEIDAIGIIAALRLAGRRALAAVTETVGPVDVVLLDGSHDWLSRRRGRLDLFDARRRSRDRRRSTRAVRMRVKADRTCASVAAASVLAKCERDALMVGLAAQHPAYGWDENKGYGAPEHLAALRELGPSAAAPPLAGGCPARRGSASWSTRRR